MNKENRVNDAGSIGLLSARNYAFTLAEVLITLAVIGIAAALTMPGIMANVNKKAWSEAQYVVRRKMQEATNQMKTAERLHGYLTTEDFVNEFRKYMKFVQVCDNTKLKDCYSPKVMVTAENEVEVNDLKTSASLGQKNYHTNTMGLVIGDGTTVILSYNPNCSFIEPTDNTADTLSCVSMIYDVNGKKKPNKIGEDIAVVNAAISTCDVKIGSLCIAGSDLSYEPIDTCSEGSGDPHFTAGVTGYKWGISGVNYCRRNFWYGAKKACEDMGMRLPTFNEFYTISDAVMKNPEKYNFSNDYYWSSTEYGDLVSAWYHSIWTNRSDWIRKNVSGKKALCVR